MSVKQRMIYYLRNEHHLNDLIEGLLTQNEVAQQFNVSKTMVRNVLLEVEPQYDTLKYNYFKKRFIQVRKWLEQGITIDVLNDYQLLNGLLWSDSNDEGLRNRLLSKMASYGVLDDIKRHHLITAKKIQTYLMTIYIDKYLSKYDVNDITKMLGVSVTRVRDVMRYKNKFGTPAPFASQVLYKNVKRNLNIYHDHLQMQSMDSLHDKYKDFDLLKLDLELIVATIAKYNIEKDEYK